MNSTSSSSVKKVGVATMWSNNYGAVLQAYALQQILIDLGYQAEVIRYHRSTSEIKPVSRWKQLSTWTIKELLDYAINIRYKRMIHSAFDEFKNRYIHFSEKDYFRDSELSKIQSKYDAIICGSDMIWSTDFEKDWPFFFLSFAESEKILAYAPSFGKNDMTDEQSNVAMSMIKRIKHLSCREEAGVAFIKNTFGLVAEHVIDPTLLLTADEWNRRLGNRERLLKKPYILNYTFHGCCHGGRREIYEIISEKIGQNYCFINGAEGKFNKYAYKGYLSPVEWVLLFRDAEFVISDTFHGMLFAMIFNKPFVVLDKKAFGASSDRLVSTLQTYGLMDRYIKSVADIPTSLMNIDYSTFNGLVGEKRQESMSYLINSLNDVIGA